MKFKLFVVITKANKLAKLSSVIARNSVFTLNVFNVKKPMVKSLVQKIRIYDLHRKSFFIISYRNNQNLKLIKRKCFRLMILSKFMKGQFEYANTTQCSMEGFFFSEFQILIVSSTFDTIWHFTEKLRYKS